MRSTSRAACFAAVCLVSVARAQTAPQPPPAAAPLLRSGMEMPGPFSGSVPSGKVTAGVLPLSLSDAIDLGLKYNLGLILGDQATRSAEAAKLRARSALLPDLSAGVSEQGQQLNFKALGFPGSIPGLPGFPVIVGPFNVLDTRAFLSQQVLNLSAIRNNRAAAENLKASRLSYADSRDVVVLAVTSLYLRSIAGAARIETTQARVDTAQALHDQAVDRKKAGVSPGIEVIQSEVELQAEQQRLIFYTNEFEKEKLNLARAIGLPLEQKFRLSDQIPYTPPPPLTYEQALEQAYRSRPDYQNALALLRAAEHTRQAATAERLPTVSFDANYGAIGPSPADSHGTFTVAGTARVSLFDGGRIRSDVEQADALVQQRKSESEDLRSRIDYEVRTVFLDLKASADQVNVARSAVDLANQQLTQSRDRFAAGVTNSVEVVQSQETLATANENYISSLYSYNLAKASLARAIGVAEKNARQFLGVSHD